MAITEGDFIKVNFTTKVKSTGDVCNTTIEELAHESGIYDENTVYLPATFVVGAGHSYEEVEKEIVGCDVGDKLSVEIPAEHAFGPRDPKLIKTLRVKEFKKAGLDPQPGLIVKYDGVTGKVLTVNGGRVKVDFNNELAGRDLICDVEVCDIVEDFDEKVKGMIQVRLALPILDVDKTTFELVDDVLSIELDPMSKFIQQSYQNISFIKMNIARDICSYIDEVNTVKFVDSFNESGGIVFNEDSEVESQDSQQTDSDDGDVASEDSQQTTLDDS